MGRIKNIIFDFGGVLVNLTRNRWVESFRQLGVYNIWENMMVNSYKHKDLYEQLELGNISTAAFRAGIRRLTKRQVTDEEIDRAWVSMLGNIPPYKLDWLLKLQENYHLCLLSNTNCLHWEWAEQNEFKYKGYEASDFFDRIYLSYKLHMQKPDHGIFQFVLDDAGIKAEETFFIDDSSANCRAAEQLGISTYTPECGEDWQHLFTDGGWLKSDCPQ